MPSWPHVFGAESGAVAASQLDDNFNVAAFAADLTTLSTAVSNLPSSATPLIPVVSGAAGVAATFSRSDHQHPPQAATPNAQVGTTYTLAATDNGKVISFTNAAAITVTIPNSLASDFSCVCWQGGAGQVTFTAGAGATQRQRSSLTKTSGQYAVVSVLGVGNSGGAAFTYILSGDMA